ncbi:MAG TPA: hypothetical protein VJK29_06810, partial [Terriglobales bacterium]|nr:hypothetical protein [Terriglobales bacterium]
MSKHNRRAFLQTSAGALAAGLGPARAALKDGAAFGDRTPRPGIADASQAIPANEGKKSLRLGLIIGIGKDPDAAMGKVHDLGLPTCQVFVDELEPGLAGRLRQA